MDVSSAPKPPNAKVFWPVWLAVLAAGIGASEYVIRHAAPNATVFRQTATGWQALPPLGSTYRIAISPRGVTWVQTSSGLSRLDGESWRSFKAADFGTRRGFLDGGFTLDGEEVWGVTTDGIVHFDGARWRLAASASQASSIAAGKGQVWAIDRRLNLSHFDGQAWGARKLDLPRPENAFPKLALTPDGTLWLALAGLWRFEGMSWTRVAGISDKAELLGVNGGVWVSDRGEVLGIDTEGAIETRYTLRQLGLPDSTKIFGVAARGPILALATSQGLVWFDGSQWHSDQIPKLGIVSVSSVEIASDGELWGIGYPRFRPSSRLIAGAAAMLLLPLAAFGSMVWWFMRKLRYDRHAMQQAVLHATGSLPDDLKGAAPSKLKLAAVITAVLVLCGVCYWLVKQKWPNAAWWLLPAFFVAAHVISTFLGGLKKRKPLPSDPIGPGGPPRYDWAKSWPAILGGLALLLVLYGDTIARYLHIPWLGFVFGGAFLVGVQYISRGYLIERQIKHCHYARALEMLNGLWGWPPGGGMKMLRGQALFFSGRAREAETIFNEQVETEFGPILKAFALEDLGRTLLAQARYTDAERAFEAATRLAPKRSAAYAGLAEVRLRQGIEPAKALENAERALQLHSESRLERTHGRERLAIIRGNQAWALALLGRAAEARQAIEAGIRDANARYMPEYVGLFWRAGMAMLALENTGAAVGYFRRAVELDPHGYYGTLAAERLKEHGVWGARAGSIH